MLSGAAKKTPHAGARGSGGVSLASVAQALGSRAKKTLRAWLGQDLRIALALDPVERRLYLRARAATVLRRGAFLRGREVNRPPLGAKSILFICHGNIIRSALAEALFNAAAGGAIRATSAGVGATPGREPDERACAAARELGVLLDKHRARAVSGELLAAADAVFVMDELNEALLLARYPEARPKLRFLGEWNPAGRSRVIADPYRGTPGDVQSCGAAIQEAAAALARALQSGACPADTGRERETSNTNSF